MAVMFGGKQYYIWSQSNKSVRVEWFALATILQATTIDMAAPFQSDYPPVSKISHFSLKIEIKIIRLWDLILHI